MLTLEGDNLMHDVGGSGRSLEHEADATQGLCYIGRALSDIRLSILYIAKGKLLIVEALEWQAQCKA